MTKTVSSRRAVTVSFVVDLLDVATNLAVAILTGSAVVFGEMAQGIADSLGSACLVVGERRAARRKDARHPFGYAREAFFWALLSALAMLVVGAGLTIGRGLQQLLHPEPLGQPLLAIAVLCLAIATNGYAVSLSARQLAAGNGGLRKALNNASEPLVKGAFVRDVIGTTTSVLGLIALLFYQVFGLVSLDAIGALLAGVMMLGGSLSLILQARALITGRSLPSEDVARLRAAILADPRVEAVNQLAAIYAGASEILVDSDLDLSETLRTTEIEDVLDELERRMRDELPGIEHVRVLLNSPAVDGASARP